MFKDNTLDFFSKNSNDLIYKINLDTNTIVWNKNLHSFLLLNENTQIKKIDDFLNLFVNENEKQAFIKRIKSKNNLEGKSKYCIKNAKKEKITIIDNYQKHEACIMGICKIKKNTNSRKISKKEKENKKKYKRLFQASKIPVLLINAKTQKIVKANDAASKFYGYTKKELRKLKISDINTLSKKEIQEEINRVQTEKKDCFNFKHKIKNGRIIDVEVYSGPLNYENQELVYSVIFNITRRKHAEKRLKQAHTIYHNTKEGIFITDLQGNILSTNKAFEDITGYKESEVLNKKSNILKSNKHSKTFYENIWSSLLHKNMWEGEIINKTKEGKIFPQWLTINTVFDEENNPINYVAVFTDVTKLKEQEQLLREKDQIMFQQSKMASMGEMLRNIAHQWRQPLSVITSSATGLKLKKEFNLLSDDDFKEFSDGILKSATYLSETIEDFSNYFKNTKNSENFLLSEILKKTAQLTDASLKNYDIQLNIEQEDENLQLYGIKNELIQVLMNLINNSKDAFKNCETNDKILNIKVTKFHTNAIITLTDNAGGIPEKILEKVFEPYFTTKHQSQGTGIGLYMSKQIIEERLNGSIYAENIFQYIKEKEYKGVQFKLIVPISKRHSS